MGPMQIVLGGVLGQNGGFKQEILGHKRCDLLFLSCLDAVPCPSFVFFFFEKGKENHPKNNDFCIPTEPLKSLEEKGKGNP